MLTSEKRALLPAETARIVLAVIGITFLVILAGKLWFQKNATEEQRKNMAEQLAAKLNGMEDGELATMLLLNLRGNYLVSYNAKLEKPSLCSFGSCICICPSTAGFPASPIRLIEACDKNGICKEVKHEMGGLSSGATFAEEINKDIFVVDLIRVREKILFSFLPNEQMGNCRYNV